MEYLAIFLAGFAGSFHCVGMCGGFACALGASGRGARATVVRHGLYNTGRLSTYVFLGALAGLLGSGLVGAEASVLNTGQRVLSVAAGLLMLMMGAQFFGYFARVHAATVGIGASSAVSALRGLLTAPGQGGPLAFGVANGFLPCPLVYAFLAKAGASGGVAGGALVMLCFGLGTFPAMLLTGGLGRALAPDWRRRGVWIAGAFLLVFGIVTIARGVAPWSGHWVSMS